VARDRPNPAIRRGWRGTAMPNQHDGPISANPGEQGGLAFVPSAHADSGRHPPITSSAPANRAHRNRCGVRRRTITMSSRWISRQGRMGRKPKHWRPVGLLQLGGQSVRSAPHLRILAGSLPDRERYVLQSKPLVPLQQRRPHPQGAPAGERRGNTAMRPTAQMNHGGTSPPSMSCRSGSDAIRDTRTRWPVCSEQTRRFGRQCTRPERPNRQSPTRHHATVPRRNWSGPSSLNPMPTPTALPAFGGARRPGASDAARRHRRPAG